MPEPQDRPILAENSPPEANHRSEGMKAGSNVDSSFHAWLTNRIASLDRKRQTAWQKLRAFLFGK